MGLHIPEGISHGGCLVDEMVSVEVGDVGGGGVARPAAGRNPTKKLMVQWTAPHQRVPRRPSPPEDLSKHGAAVDGFQGWPFLLAMEKCRRQSPPIAGAHSRPTTPDGEKSVQQLR